MKKTATLSNNRIIDETISHQPSDRIQRQFTQCYLESYSERSLISRPPAEHAAFIQERFAFFKTAIGKSPRSRIFVPEKKNLQFHNKHVLEFVCPDAQFLLATIEAIFKQEDLRITRMLHPIMTVEMDPENVIKEIKSPKIGGSLISVSYIEFEGISIDFTPKSLLAKIERHMSATIAAHQAFPSIINTLSSVQSLISKNEFSLSEPKEEWINLIDWLRTYNFTFLGAGVYEIKGSSGKHTVTFNKKEGLGVLAPEMLSGPLKDLQSALDDHVREMANSPSPFVFDTIRYVSPTQRFENIMRLSFKIPQTNGHTKEYIFLGILKRSSLLAKNLETPLIHRKIKSIFEAKNMLPGSYDFNQIIRLFTSIPKFELFRTPVEDLLQIAEDLLSITNPNDFYCFVRTPTETQELPIMIALPPMSLTPKNKEFILTYLTEKTPNISNECIEISGDQFSRLHIYLKLKTANNNPINCTEIEDYLRNSLKPWDDHLKEIISKNFPGPQGKGLFNRYYKAFPEHYRIRRAPQENYNDIFHLEELRKNGKPQFNIFPFYFPDSALSGKVSCLAIYNVNKIELFYMMPILENLGINVLDELTTRIGSIDSVYGYIHTFRITDSQGNRLSEEKTKINLISLLNQTFGHNIENDPLNCLLVKADLPWQEISVIQTYRNYFLQLFKSYSRTLVNKTLIKHPKITQQFISFFEVRFSTDTKTFGPKGSRLEPQKRIKQEFAESLRHVDDISEDTILRRLFNLIEGTVRTNYYHRREDTNLNISIKLDPSLIEQMPQPSPYREIFVYGSHMEGTHIRFGPISRGGVRWSNRESDFRSEVLDLAKTQQVKNVVIIPMGSKGVFVLKNPPTDREALNQTGQDQYKQYIQALLDITDTIDSKGKIKTAKNTISYDSQDPYLVIAADKGTASFSDLANQVSIENNFWLGDAFASGGSSGYNHKEEGITARGAWE
ncbi:MAG: glutamate dehydrogenase, partial [Candidatus Marinamargulisbacteria bacterium]